MKEALTANLGLRSQSKTWTVSLMLSLNQRSSQADRHKDQGLPVLSCLVIMDLALVTRRLLTSQHHEGLKQWMLDHSHLPEAS